MNNLTQEALKSILLKGISAQEINAIGKQAALDINLYEKLVALAQDENETTRMKSSWALSKASESQPEFGNKHIELFLKLIDEEKTPGVVREIFKSLACCVIPEKHEGVYIDICFNLLRSNETEIAVKHHTKIALFKYWKKFPDLKNEFIESLRYVSNSHTAAWQVQVRKSIDKLEKSSVKNFRN